MLGVVAVATTLLVVVSPGMRVHPSVAMVFERLASRAAKVQALRPGQYDYTETWGPGDSGSSTLTGTPAHPVTVHYYLLVTTQTWVGPDGSGRRQEKTDPVPQFTTATDRAEWLASGRSLKDIPTGVTTQVEVFGPGGVPGKLPLYNVAALPTKRAPLESVLATGTGLPRALDGEVCPRPATLSCTVFLRAAALLVGPDSGSSPALRAALYRVLATVPGVHDVGRVRDHYGTRGTGLELVHHYRASRHAIVCPGFPTRSEARRRMTVSVPAYASIIEIIVNPATGGVLSINESGQGTPRTRALSACYSANGQITTTVTSRTSWRTVLSTGVVSSETAVPKSKVTPPVVLPVENQQGGGHDGHSSRG